MQKFVFRFTQIAGQVIDATRRQYFNVFRALCSHARCAMEHPTRDGGETTGLEPLLDPIDVHFQFTLKHDDKLIFGVAVNRALIEQRIGSYFAALHRQPIQRGCSSYGSLAKILCLRNVFPAMETQFLVPSLSTPWTTGKQLVREKSLHFHFLAQKIDKTMDIIERVDFIEHRLNQGDLIALVHQTGAFREFLIKLLTIHGSLRSAA